MMLRVTCAMMPNYDSTVCTTPSTQTVIFHMNSAARAVPQHPAGCFFSKGCLFPSTNSSKALPVFRFLQRSHCQRHSAEAFGYSRSRAVGGDTRPQPSAKSRRLDPAVRPQARAITPHGVIILGQEEARLLLFCLGEDLEVGRWEQRHAAFQEVFVEGFGRIVVRVACDSSSS